MKEMSNISDRYQERDETFVSQKNLLEVSPGIISVKRKRIKMKRRKKILKK